MNYHDQSLLLKLIDHDIINNPYYTDIYGTCCGRFDEYYLFTKTTYLSGGLYNLNTYHQLIYQYDNLIFSLPTNNEVNFLKELLIRYPNITYHNYQLFTIAYYDNAKIFTIDDLYYFNKLKIKYTTVIILEINRVFIK